MSVPSVGRSTPVSFGALAICREALQLVLRHAGVFASQAIVFSALMLAIWLLTRLLFGPADSPGNSITAAELVNVVASFVLYVNIYVGTARLAVCGEPPSIAGLFVWGGRQWRMLGVSLLSMVIIIAPFILIVAICLVIILLRISVPGVFTDGALILGILPSLGWGIFAIAKLGFIAAIVANDGSPGAIRQSWNLTRGYALPLMGGILLTLFPSVVVVLTLGFSIEDVSANNGYLVIADSLIEVTTVIWLTAFLSLAYAKLRGAAPA